MNSPTEIPDVLKTCGTLASGFGAPLTRLLAQVDAGRATVTPEVHAELRNTCDAIAALAAAVMNEEIDRLT